jgi:hypothetical protein
MEATKRLNRAGKLKIQSVRHQPNTIRKQLGRKMAQLRECPSVVHGPYLDAAVSYLRHAPRVHHEMKPIIAHIIVMIMIMIMMMCQWA